MKSHSHGSSQVPLHLDPHCAKLFGPYLGQITLVSDDLMRILELYVSTNTKQLGGGKQKYVDNHLGFMSSIVLTLYYFLCSPFVFSR